jgi:elongation factor 2
VCLKLLAEEFAGCELVLSQPIVQYQETVAASAAAIQNAQPLFVKSANKHVKLWGNAYALNGALVEVLQNEGESFVKSLEQNSTETRERLVSEFDWERDDTKRIWVFGPELGGAAAPPTNVLVDQCKQVQGLAAIRDSITTSFGEVVQRGALAGERLRGVRFNLLDASVHSDAAHRGAGQVIPMARRLFQGAQLAADPRLEEPIYLTEIQVPQDVKNSIYALIARRRG